MDINEDFLKGKWTEIKGKIQEQWGKLTDDDISRINGRYNELFGIIQQKYGLTKEQVQKEIENFINEQNK